MKNLMSICWLIAVLSLMTIITSCQEYMPFEEHDLVVQTYEQDFVNEFGKPAENHPWGFVAQTPMVFELTRSIETSKQVWPKNYYGHLNIPGFPDHLHGYFRGSKTVNSDGTYITKMTKAEFDAGHASDENNWANNNVGEAIGDVTEEEREFVWNWFHTHKNPTSTAIQWQSFFVQNVSSWAMRHPNTSGRIMDHLGYEKSSGEFEHINGYNSSNGGIMYVYDAGTAKWSYWASFSSQYQNDKFNIQHLVFEIPQTNCPEGCSVHHYDGWYVGFDYEAVVKEGDGSIRKGSVYADEYYDDWIIKVSPGNQVGYPETVRVMCEDLGQTNSDWDFNDVVFDVSFRKYGDEIRACIAIQAAGGTLPITVGTKDMNFEVHKLLGSNSMSPIIHPATFAYYEVPFSAYTVGDNVLNAKSIPVYINGSEEATYYTLTNSNIAQKFACPDYVPWTDENQPISDLYPQFSSWVQNAKSSPWSISNATSSVITETAEPNAFINSGDDGCQCEHWTPGQAVDGQNGSQNEGVQDSEDNETGNTDSSDAAESESTGTDLPEESAVTFTNTGVDYNGMTCYAISKEELLKVSTTGSYKITVIGKGVAYNESSVELVYDLAHPEWGEGQHQVTAFGNTQNSVNSGATDEAPVQLTTTLTAAQVETLFGTSNFLGGTLLVAVSNISDVKFYVQ